MSLDICANCDAFVDTDVDGEAYELRGKQNEFCLCPSCRESYGDNEFTPEIDDTVMFLAIGRFGQTSGEGRVARVYGNGALDVVTDNQKYKTSNYFILRKAG